MERVVRIDNGEVIDAFVEEWGAVWRLRHLKKDGTPPLGRLPDGQLADPPDRLSLGMWAKYNAKREITASVIRDRITALRDEVASLAGELLSLYKEG